MTRLTICLSAALVLAGASLTNHAVADPDSSPAVSKPTPQPDLTTGKPQLSPRGTPTVSDQDQHISDAVASDKECKRQLKLAGKLTSAEKEELLTQCKDGGLAGGGVTTMAITYDSNYDYCVNSTKTLCASPDVWRIARKVFSVSSSADLVVKTNTFSAISGSVPDTVLYVVKCTDSNCTSGDIMGSNDDGNTETSELYDSKVTITSPASGTWAAIVVAYSFGRNGLTTIDISQSGGFNATYNNEAFAGWHIKSKELKTSDVLLVAKNPGSPSMTTSGYATYHDSSVFVASTMTLTCTSNCGKFQFQDDTVFGTSATTYQTRMTIGSSLGSPTDARIVVGVYDNGTVTGGEYYRMNARFAHVRRHTPQGAWTTSAQDDLDSDGLTSEVEDQLGTCDSSATDENPDGGADVIATGYNCNSARDWVNGNVDTFSTSGTSCATSPAQSKCWGPADSDHDGIEDAAEFFAVAVGCDTGPTGPYRSASGCAKPSPVFGSCDSGDWCAVEPRSSAAPGGPYFDHDPTMYDIYVESDYFNSTVFTETADLHALNSTQQGQVAGLFTTDPSKCWDGSAGACPGSSDLKYRVQVHGYRGTACSVGDDRFAEDLSTGSGSTFASSHFFSRFSGAMRYAGVAGYALAWHNSSAWTRSGEAQHVGSRQFWHACVDSTNQAGQARSVYGHELGHTLGLDHMHAGPDSNCCSDGTACNFGAATCSTAVSETPVPATPMSYQHSPGAFPMQAAPPASTSATSACSETNRRFSKGLLGVVNEQSLDETMAPTTGWAEWQLRLLAQSLFCYDSFNDSSGVGRFRFSDAGPYCDVNGQGQATTCYFNWNAGNKTAANASANPYQLDLTAGRWVAGSTSSNTDQLRDLDEWAKMIAIGKGRLTDEPSPEMCLFGTTFNGAVTTNDYCGWQETISATNVTAGQVNYPISGCTAAADCLQTGATCRKDECTVAGDCRDGGQGCAGGVCNCADDTDCWSGTCVGGKCVTSWGGCSCSNNAECAGTGGVCVADGFCRGWIAATSAQSGTNVEPWPLLDSAALNGTNARIELTGGTNSRLETLGSSYRNAFMLKFDFRFDGFGSGETSHVLFKSGAFSMTFVSANGQVNLQASTGGHTALVFTGIQKGRWYRAVWGATRTTSDEHFLHVRKWALREGWYDPGTAAADCVYQTWDSDLPSPGTVYIGHDGSADSSLYFNGRLDKVQLLNYMYSSRPSACTLQQ